jgi:hypothetical protein
VAKKALLLTSIGFYQIVRFVVLMVFLVVMVRVSSPPSLSGVAIAVGGAAILPTLMILQLVLTGSRPLVAPLRVALTLQLVGALITFSQVSFVQAAMWESSAAAVGAAGILVLLDAASLLFLLLFNPQSDLQDSKRDTRGTESQPRISVEEVEEQ